MVHRDVLFLPSPSTFYITHLKDCGRGESYRTATCHITVVGDKQGHARSNILWLGASKGMLPVTYCAWGKQGHTTCNILCLGASKGIIL